eukprot:g3170.t1
MAERKRDVVCMCAADMLDLPMFREKISFGCSVIDRAMGGGISRIGITEIAGAAGSGKTQLAMQLCVRVQLSRKYGGLDGAGAAYICTEHHFPTERLEQMIASAKEETGVKDNMMDRVHIVRVNEPTDLWGVLRKVPLLINHRNVRLIVIDSIAALFRGEFQGSSAADMQSRAQMMLQLAARMKRISRQHGECAKMVTVEDHERLCHRDIDLMRANPK